MSVCSDGPLSSVPECFRKGCWGFAVSAVTQGSRITVGKA